MDNPYPFLDNRRPSLDNHWVQGLLKPGPPDGCNHPLRGPFKVPFNHGRFAIGDLAPAPLARWPQRPSVRLFQIPEQPPRTTPEAVRTGCFHTDLVKYGILSRRPELSKLTYPVPPERSSPNAIRVILRGLVGHLDLLCLGDRLSSHLKRHENHMIGEGGATSLRARRVTFTVKLRGLTGGEQKHQDWRL